MNDLDQQVRDRLRDDAEAFLRHRGAATITESVMRRVRRRRAVGVTAALGLAVAVGFGAVAVISAVIGGRVAEERPGATPIAMRPVTELGEAATLADPEVAWRGIWPEVAEPAARDIQRLAESNPALLWRLDPEATATRYVRDVFGWDDFETASGDRSDGVVRVRFDRARGGPATDDIWYEPLAEVVVERVQGLGVSTIWSVTGLLVPATSQGDLLAEIAVEDLLGRRAHALTAVFLERRVEGSPVAAYLLGPDAERSYREHRHGLYLYGAQTDMADAPGHPEGHPTLAYGGFDIISAPRPRGDGTFETLVTLKVLDPNDGGPPTGPSTGQPEILRIGPVDGLLRIISVTRR